MGNDWCIENDFAAQAELGIAERKREEDMFATWDAEREEYIIRLERQLAELRKVIVHVYNSGYHAGHHYTVEGGYADIHSQDMDTYQADVVCELIEDLIGSQARAEVERVLEGVV